MSLVAKLLCLVFMLGGGLSVQARDLYILVLGEGAAVNCNARSLGNAAGVLIVSTEHDLAGCRRGSPWISLGQSLIHQGAAQRVVFVPIPLSGARVQDWRAGGRDAGLLNAAVDKAIAQNMVFDYAFWQQGFSDSRTDGASYRNDLRTVIRSISLKIKIRKWLVAQGGGCVPGGSPEIAAIQREVGLAHAINRFAGPNLTELAAVEVSADCTFSTGGQRKAARLWQASMRMADVDSENFQKESLLYYFK